MAKINLSKRNIWDMNRALEETKKDNLRLHNCLKSVKAYIKRNNAKIARIKQELKKGYYHA